MPCACDTICFSPMTPSTRHWSVLLVDGITEADPSEISVITGVAADIFGIGLHNAKAFKWGERQMVGSQLP